MNIHNFRDINVGDLIIQKMPNPLNLNETLQKRGIIIAVTNNTSTIEWTIDFSDVSKELKTTTILNVSLRKMIMDGFIKHYPINK